MPDYDWEPTDWERERREEEEIYWQKQKEYWERFRRWQEQKERERWKKINEESNYIAVIIGIIVVVMLCFALLISI